MPSVKKRNKNLLPTKESSNSVSVHHNIHNVIVIYYAEPIKCECTLAVVAQYNIGTLSSYEAPNCIHSPLARILHYITNTNKNSLPPST
jgi:hypothetical protein